MSDFKLIAIRPRKGCDPKFLKVLKEDVIYQFYDNYILTPKDSNLDEVDIIPNGNYNVPPELYYINKAGRKSLPVNISAVVGKNGSGKSALTELFYLSIHNLSFALGIIKEDIDADPPLVPAFVPGVNVDLYYTIGENLYTLKIDQFLLDNCNTDTANPNGSFILKKNNDVMIPTIGNKAIDIFKNIFPENSFYTIAINYSLYGLNSEQVGQWVRSLFHKNDGYQTPIVINPYRDNGNIEVNTENDLVYQRLLSNILEPVDNNDLLNSLRNLANDKIATSLILTAKEGYARSTKERQAYDKEQFNIEIINENEYVSALFEEYTKEPFAKFENNFFKEIIENYAQVKLRKICKRYDRYKEFLPLYYYDGKMMPGNQYVNLPKLITTFLEDSSHVVFKLKQALNFLAYASVEHAEWLDFLFVAYMDGNPEMPVTPKFNYTQIHNKPYLFFINAIALKIKMAKETAKKKGIELSTIELLPPAIFEISIELQDDSDFKDLSSGEKQKIYSLSSIVYHITNLNSVFKNGKSHELKLIEYKYLNIIFDEVELYFHPEFQRVFISDLLSYIGRVSVANIDKIEGINICFATHSPFILSDIPNQNILRLVDGKPEPYIKSEKTFGANVHDLLANDFFMKNGFIGELAKHQVEKLISFFHSIHRIDPS